MSERAPLEMSLIGSWSFSWTSTQCAVLVLDDAGNVIGSASDYIYSGSGFAVHTRPFGGYVAESQIEFVR